MPAELQWNATPHVPIDFGGPEAVPFEAFGRDQPGIGRFEAISQHDPDRIAIDDGHRRLTYRQVRRSVHALMAKLADLPKGRPIVAVLHNTATFPIAFLAHLGTGRALVPIDAGDPPDRQRAILQETAPAAILTGEGVTLDPNLFDPDIPHIQIDPDPTDPDTLPACTVALSDLAGIAYSSGSTGRPKGLAFGQRQFLSGTADYGDACHINAGDRILCLASHSGAGCRDALVALLSGATLHIVNIKTSGVGAVIRALDTNRITVLSFVPSVLRVLARLDGAAAAFRNLRILDLFGDRTTAADLDLLHTVLPADCKIRLSLASTEAATMFQWFVRRDALLDNQPVPCGYPAPGLRFALLDEAGNPAAEGEPGELVVRGRSLAIGAWQHGRLLPGPFLSDPDDPHARIFHTGDVIRLRPDGLAEFHGRRDRRVKVRGLRADPAELEDALRMHPGIADVAAVPLTVDDETILVAYAVPADPSAAPDPDTLRIGLIGTLPTHLVPARIQFLPTIPRLPNFKPDLLALQQHAARP